MHISISRLGGCVRSYQADKKATEQETSKGHSALERDKKTPQINVASQKLHLGISLCLGQGPILVSRNPC